MTDLLARLKINRPLIVAPMAGGPTTVALVAASSNAGALGSLGAAYLKPNEIAAAASQIRALTKRAFAINLFVPEASVAPTNLDRAISATVKYREELGLPAPKLEAPYAEDFDQQFEQTLRAQPVAISFVFGLLKPEHVRAAHAQGAVLMGTATTADEAGELEEAGIDAIVLQGFEAGGHRGIFDARKEDPAIGLADLLTLTKSRVKRPLIAAGGIMTREHIEHFLSAGAVAVQLGTAFLTCTEAGTSKPYRERLAKKRETKTTRAFSGRFARGLINRFMIEMEKDPAAIMPFPAQNKFTRDLRTASAAQGSGDFLSLWCGTGAGELWTGSAAELIEKLIPQR